MAKKLTAVLVLFVVVLVTLIYVAKGKLLTQVTAQLQQQGIQVAQLEVDFLPVPSLSAKNVQYSAVIGQKPRSIFAAFLRVEFNPWQALFGKMEIAKFAIKDGQLWLSDNVNNPEDFTQIQFIAQPNHSFLLGDIFQHPEFVLNSTQIELSAMDIAKNAISFRGELRWQENNRDESLLQLNAVTLHVAFSQPIYNNQAIDMALSKGEFTLGQNYTQYRLTDLQLNNENFGESSGEYRAENNKLSWNGQLLGAGKVSVQYLKGQDIAVAFSDQPLGKYLRTLNIPELADGTVSGNLYLTFAPFAKMEWRFERGNARLHIANGKIKGINLLALLSQYFPLNYDPSATITTSFQDLDTEFTFDPMFLMVNHIAMDAEQVALKGSGELDLRYQQCDFQLTLSPQEQKYQQFALPIHFFDRCDQPKYEVKINKVFQNQLKEFIKEKFK